MPDSSYARNAIAFALVSLKKNLSEKPQTIGDLLVAANKDVVGAEERYIVLALGRLSAGSFVANGWMRSLVIEDEANGLVFSVE